MGYNIQDVSSVPGSVHNEVVDDDGNEYNCADWKDSHGLLDVIDAQLNELGYELRVGEYGDDNVWVAVVKL